MNEPLERERFKYLAAGFVVNDLTAEEADEFQQWLEQHPEMVSEVEDLQEVLWQLLDEFTEVEAPLHLLPQVLDQAKAESSERQLTVANPRPFQWGRITRSIAALFIVILGVDYCRLRQNFGVVTAENQHLRQEFAQVQGVQRLIQEPNTRLLTFKAVNPMEKASGSILMNPEQQKTMMLIQNLQAPPPGHVYVLWVVLANRKMPCGELKPYTWGNSAYDLPMTPEMYQDFDHPQFSGLVVTLEASAKVSRPTGPIVMQSSPL